MKAYVINLERSVERRRSMERQFSQLNGLGMPFEVVPAVDGRTLDMRDRTLVDPGLHEVVRQRTGGGAEGVAGCALSHARVYRKILDTTAPWAAVLEDDAVLPGDFPHLVDTVGRSMQGSEVVLLHYANRQGCRVARQDAIDVGRSRLLARPVAGCDLTSSAAYLITRTACLSLLEGTLPVRTYPDDWAVFCRQGLLQRVRCVVPMPVLHSAHFRSTIDYWEPDSARERLGAWVQRADLPVVKQLLRARRARQFRARGWFPEVTLVDDAGS